MSHGHDHGQDHDHVKGLRCIDGMCYTMKLQPVAQWKCDACGQIIANPEAGWVEWMAGPTPGTKAHGFRIVHNSNRCQYPSSARVRDTHLVHLVGPDGLSALLTLLAPDRQAGSREPGVANLDEWGELVRRLHIPHYEEARQYWSDAVADGLFSDPNAPMPYSQQVLLRILDRYGHGHEASDTP